MKKTIVRALINKAIAVITVGISIHFFVCAFQKVLPFGLNISLDTPFGALIWVIWSYGGFVIAALLLVFGIKNFLGDKLVNKLIDKIS